MNSNLKGKVAVVTGASKGIGAAIAKKLASHGALVAVNYASDKTGADKTVNDIQADGGRAIAIQGNVANAEDVARIFKSAAEKFGKVDILVNNAGIYNFGPLEDVSAEEFYHQYNVNVLGTLLAAKEALKYFPAEGGSIINLSSVVSTGPMPNTSIYSSTKGAVDTITKALAVELAPRKIRVNAIAPGLTETEGLDAAGMKGSEFEQGIIAATPLARMGQPDDIARVAVFLASDDAAWVTGEKVTASGGLR
ncbi:glucose 1-dehydrogenase [Flavobacterium sp. D11R37]|uniref:SDR family NAD(P)-dependent oxidoreductase n=1 Tax=Flavobacterium coralii TaxID=2838017 RepID=UPI001CA63EC7|nr:glucose 1-dehydrogenase [Flavobacterium coralii]MBY8963917.1 glucose 1-dehydrogenase [Flavobacterium coralii]